MLSLGAVAIAGCSEAEDGPITLASGCAYVTPDQYRDITPVADWSGTVPGAAFVNDTELVVADGQNGTLSFISWTGRLIRTAGGIGSGPAEFRMIRAVLPYAADTVVVHDRLLARLSWATVDSGVVRTESLRGGPGVPVAGVDSSGVLLVSNRTSRGRVGTALTLVQDTLAVEFVDRATGTSTEVARVPDTPRLMESVRTFGVLPAPFAPKPVVVYAMGTVTVLSGNDTIRRFAWDGQALPGIVLPWKAGTVDRTRLESWNTWLAQDARTAAQTQSISEMLRGARAPEHMPVHGEARADRSGVLWVTRYVPPFDASPIELARISPDGEVAPAGALPPGSRLLAASPLALAVAVKDSLMVEHVRVLPLACEAQ